VREIVLVISDLYLPPAELGNSSKLSGTVAISPGLQYMARFGQKSSIHEDWRSWLARWLGRDDLARAAPAAIASATIRASPSLATTDGTAWFATPVHLMAGLTSLHLDRRGLLQLREEELHELARDFSRVFGESEFHLETIGSDLFLMRNRDGIVASTTEPARAVGSELRSVLPTGRNASALRRLGAELEMWLHEHPINQHRAARGELPVSTLWLWGGGGAPEAAAARSGDTADVALSCDPFLNGLWRLQGLEPLPFPERLPDLASYPHARKVVLIAKVTPLLHANPHWTIFEALAELDRRFIAPALTQLHSGKLSSVLLIANDVQLRIKRRDNLRFWRRAPPPGAEVLREK
jgi:hypothetical protein